MNEIERLETWTGGHKARWCNISIDNGYGASCWQIELHHEHGATYAQEVAFVATGDRDADRAEARNRGVVMANDFDDDADEWPGLAKTISCALDAFEKGIWKAK